MKRLIVASALLALVACGPPSSNQQQVQQQEAQNKQGIQSVGMPAITHFTEMRNLKNIYELRDQTISTFTYITDLYGHLHKICDSIGYGIPYSTQMSPPTAYVDEGSGRYQEPFREPNGLFPPSSAAGTWVQCLNPKTKQIQPQYIEPEVIVTTYALQTP